MAGLTPTRVNHARALVCLALRAAATLLLAWGAYLFLKKLLFALGNPATGLHHMFRVYMEIGETQSTYRGLAAMIVGAGLAIASRNIARWVVCLPSHACPACGYAGGAGDRCPECGLTGLLDRPDSPGAERPDTPPHAPDTTQ
jgi:hypothetical protein